MKTISDFMQQTTEGVIAFHAVSKEAIAWATMPRYQQYHSGTDNTLVFPWPSEKHAAENFKQEAIAVGFTIQTEVGLTSDKG